MTVHGWVAHARGSQSNSRLTVHDVFPAANADWDDATIRAKGIKTKNITAEDGTRLPRLR